jgi:hypothetical protein
MIVQVVIGQAQDRISHQLTRAVVGSPPSSLGLNHLDAESAKGGWRATHVLVTATPSQGDDWQVLPQQQNIPDFVTATGLD